MSGYIKIHRQILEWEWYSEPNCFRVFMHLLLTVNWKDKKWRGMVIKKGSIITGRNLLAEQCGLSVQQLRTVLSKLQSTNEITIKTNSQGTVIHVVKYKDYQQATNEATSNQPAINQQSTTTKEGKERKEVNIPAFEDFLTYAKEKKPKVDAVHLKLKYDAWVENKWKDGNDRKIKNWKTKLLNTLKFIDEVKNNEEGYVFGKTGFLHGQ